MTAKTMAQHNSMAILLNAALGGNKDAGAPVKPGDPGVRDIGAGHATVEDAVAAINAFFTV